MAKHILSILSLSPHEGAPAVIADTKDPQSCKCTRLGIRSFGVLPKFKLVRV